MALYIHRLLSDSILEANASFPVILVTGPRQAGKTTMLLKLAEGDKKRTYVSLDDPETRRLAVEEPGLFFQRFEGDLLIDEIQYAPDLLVQIKMIVDRERFEVLQGTRQQKDSTTFWLTGSQQFHVMKGVRESLAGRIAIFRLQSLSQSEITGTGFGPFTTESGELIRRSKKTEILPVGKTFFRIFRGGMPELIARKDVQQERFFSSYIQTYLERDIRELTQASHELQFFHFLQICAARTATMIVYDELAKECGITIPTVKQWLSILASTGIITLISPWFPNVLKRIVKAPRLYFLDTGLCAHLLKWPNPETLEAGPQSGAFFETWVVSEIYKSFLNAGREPPLYYYRDKDKKEIDLLIHADGLLHPIEIKKTSSPNKSMISNFSVLEPLNTVNKTDRAAPFSPSVGTGALICQYPQVLPLNDRNSIVPAALI